MAYDKWFQLKSFKITHKSTRKCSTKAFKGLGTRRIKSEDNLALTEDLIVERKVWNCKTGFEIQ